MGKPLGIPLGIDFAKLDADLRKIADKIEQVGKSSSIQLGAGTRDLAAGNMDPDKLGSAVESVGTRLSAGIADGIRGASVMMLSFASNINAMLERLVGATITMFRRIDASMKFPVIVSFFDGLQAKASNMSRLVSKPMTDVDKAIGGQFGSMIMNMTRVLRVLFAELAASISASMTKALAGTMTSVASLSAQMTKASTETQQFSKFVDMGTEGLKQDVVQLDQILEKSSQISKFPPMGKGGLKTSIGGPKIGAGTDFTAGESASAGPVVKEGMFDSIRIGIAQMKQFNAEIKASGGYIKLVTEAMGPWAALIRVPAVALQYFWTGLGYVEQGVTKVLGAIVSLGLKAGTVIYRMTNYFSALGSIGGQSYTEIYQKHGILLGSMLAMTKAVGGMFGLFRGGAASTTAAMGTTRTSVNQVTGAVMGLGKQLLLAFGIVGVIYKVVTFFKDGIKGAAELNDTVKVSKEIFGSSFGGIESQANSISKKYGIMRNEQVKIANQFGAMAQGAGYTEAASAKLANTFTQLTLNFAQTWSLPFEEAAEKVRGGLAGQARGLKQYGVFITDAEVKTAALADGMASMSVTAGRSGSLASSSMKKMSKGFSSVETPGKVSKGGGRGTAKIVVDKDVGMMERANIIMQSLAYTTGALDRAAGGASAQFRKAGGGVGEFGVRIGEILLPAVNMGTEAFNILLSSVIDLFETHKTTIENWVSYITGGMSNVAFVARNLGDVWKIVQLKIGEFVINSVAQIQALADNWSPLWAWLKRNWLGLLEDMLVNMKAFGTNLLTNAMNLGKALWEALKTGEFKFDWTPLTEGFQRTTEALPEMIKPALISVDEEVNKIWAGIQKKELALKGMPIGPAPKKPGEAKEPAKTPEYKLAGIVEAGSKEAYSILARSATLGRGQSVGDKQVNLLSQSVAVQKDLLNETKKSNKGPTLKVV